MATALVIATAGLTTAGGPAFSATDEARPAIAWRDGSLQVDRPGLVSRSDIVLEGPSWRAHQSMPLGNGHLGAAVWAEDGFTAQLNRNDTFPDLKSAGQLVVPGLFPLVSATDYRGRLQLHSAELSQTGSGMTARAFVRADTDQFVLEVTGADPAKPQTAVLQLWEGRQPATYAEDGVAALAETFTDEASGTTTGAVAAMTAHASGVAASVVDEHTVRLNFTPRPDGSFRVVVGVPSYTGGSLEAAVRGAVAGATEERVDEAHLAWWQHFWTGVAPMKISSEDGTGEYMESLRAQQLYMTAASERGTVPSSHGGVVNMFSPWQDQIHWSSDYWWHFNLREQVFANFGADTEEFNEAYLRLYTDRLEQMRGWTDTHWPEADGVCVPEYLRFDGTAGACDSSAEPSWLNRIVSTGPEVAYNIWLQYRYTGDRSVLDTGYPLMRDVARFYLSILQEGDDGYLHLEHVNALEVQWDTTDPTPDLAAMRVLFPIVARLAAERGDDVLADRIRAAIPRIPPFRTITRNGEEVIAWSGTDEPEQNTQNPEMQALWPWGLFGADSELMQNSFANRVFVQTREWAADPIWAGRLGLAGEAKELLIQGTKDFQIFPNGFTGHGIDDDPIRVDSYYSEWGAVVAATLQEGLVQAYDGTVRVAKSWPADWAGSGAVQIEGGHRVSTEVRDDVPAYVGIEAERDDTLSIENPWPGVAVRVVDGETGTGRPIVGPTTTSTIELPVEAGKSYLLERIDRPHRSLPFSPIDGEAASSVKHLGERTLGVTGGTPQIRSDLVSVVRPDRLDALVQAAEGVQFYVDRSYEITDLPEPLNGTVLIRGANEDSKLTEPEDYLVLDLQRPATVHVAFDLRGEGTWWPGWLEEQGFVRTDMIVQTSDVPLVVFEAQLPAGAAVLGPNSDMPGEGNSSYITFVSEAAE